MFGIIIFVGFHMFLKIILHGLSDPPEEIDLENIVMPNIIYLFMIGPVCILGASAAWLVIYCRHFFSLALWFSGLYAELDCVEYWYSRPYRLQIPEQLD